MRAATWTVAAAPRAGAGGSVLLPVRRQCRQEAGRGASRPLGIAFHIPHFFTSGPKTGPHWQGSGAGKPVPRCSRSPEKGKPLSHLKNHLKKVNLSLICRVRCFLVSLIASAPQNSSCCCTGSGCIKEGLENTGQSCTQICLLRSPPARKHHHLALLHIPFFLPGV